MKKKVILYICLAIFTLIVAYGLYYFPIQKHLAEKSFDKYIKLQNISEDNIQSKKIFKDYTQSGYFINVVYKDDPDLRYEYKYFVGDNAFKNTFNIQCVIYNKSNMSIAITKEQAKHPALKNRESDN